MAGSQNDLACINGRIEQTRCFVLTSPRRPANALNLNLFLVVSTF